MILQQFCNTMNHKLVNGKISIECSYITKPGVKVAYEKTVFYRRTSDAKKILDNSSGDLVVDTGIGVVYKGFELNVSNAVNKSWSKSHSFASQTESEEMSLTEKRVEYYDHVTILSRSIRLVYFIDGQVIEHTKDKIVQSVTSNTLSLNELELEAKKYMKNRYGVENSTKLETSFSVKVKLYEIWKPFVKGDILPKDAVYAGNTFKDGAVYVARVDNTPGKVTLKNGRIDEFSVKELGCSSTGEILLTNKLWEWKEIKRDWTVPKNAVKNGRSRWGYENFIGKALCGEPGRLYPFGKNYKNVPAMSEIKCFTTGVVNHGYILVYSKEA